MASGVSYNGWAANSSPAAIGVVDFSPLGIRTFGNGGFAGGVKGGAVHAIFTDLVERLNEIEPVMRDPSTGQLGYGCWGYGYRANVNNPSQLSCHASGTAIDYNAPKHGNGTSIGAGNSGWSLSNIARVKALLVRYDGVVRWLSNNDPMHFEISGTAANVAAVAAKIDRLEAGEGETATPVPDPVPAPVPEVEDDMFDESARSLLADIQNRLIKITDGDQSMNAKIIDLQKQVDALKATGQDTFDRVRGPQARPFDSFQEISAMLLALGAPPQWTPEQPKSEPETAWYTVQPGDTLSGIAAKYGIPDWHSIATLNGITDPQSIQPNDKIRVK